MPPGPPPARPPVPPRPAAPPRPVAEATQVIRTEPKPPGPVDIFELAGVGDPLKLDPSTLGQRRGERYRIPVGVAEDQQPVLLDLVRSPAALGVFGSTDSDRAPFLHSLLFGMAATHTPEEIAFCCVGGATTQPTWDSLTQLPHTAAVQTLGRNPRDEHRLIAALEGELERRAELLAGLSTQHFTDYQVVQPQVGLDPMPLLVVAVDMLPLLLDEAPGTRPVLEKLQAAEHLGIKLVYSAVGPSGLPTRLAHRGGAVVLHTCSEFDAMPLLGRDGELPHRPDEACLVTRGAEPVRFRTAHANLPHASSTPGHPVPTYQLFADRVQHQVAPTRQLLMSPPGHEPPAGIDAGLPPLVTSEERGYGAKPTSPLAVSIGTLDNPREHRNEPLHLDFTADGALAIVGRPRSGKTTAVLTTLLALALTSTPTEVRFHCLAFGGNGLLALAELPHSGVVVPSCDRERIDQALTDLESTMDQRVRRFAAEGIDSAAEFRRRRAESDLGAAATDHVLVIDGWPEVHQHPGLVDRVLRVARRGPEHGIHLVTTANRWDDLPRELRELTRGRIELRLTDPRESLISTPDAERLPDEAGHCLHRELPGTINLPVLNNALPSYFEYHEHGLPDDLPTRTRALIARITEAWPGQAPGGS
ncbi:FtsK/SpoIIIE domain-containing protein [Saccharopolyspora sp. NPDC000359]|uniref:FtsK/SpoIIIE domain-containing protein n=1 Tax=Saccharopolyspora sp. NPDC000359 TaxID=3154251 RepID=UPI00332C337E